MTQDPARMVDASAIVEGVLAGQWSCVEIAQQYLARLERDNRVLNAVVTFDPDAVLREAERLDRLRLRGTTLPLHGVPVTIKDTIPVKGMRTTSGAVELADYVPLADAPAVAALRAAGATIIGKTNVPKFAGDYQTYNRLFGATHNPWRIGLSPGGSSGGSAASVASGMSAVDLASDHAGSLTLPAHYCGVLSHKPTFGLVSQAGHIPPGPSAHAPRDMTVLGPLARSVRDLETLVSVLAPRTFDRRERGKWLTHRPCDIRLAVWFDDPFLPLDREVSTVLMRAADVLADAGVRVSPDGRPRIALEDIARLGIQLFAASAAPGYSDDRYAGAKEWAAALPEDSVSLLDLMARAVTMDHRRWLQLDEERWAAVGHFEQLFDEFDAVLCPVSPVAAFLIDSESGRLASISVDGESRSYFEQAIWPAVVSSCYLPATVVPVGQTSSGLPVALQVVSNRYGDGTTMAIARVVEELLGGFREPRRPRPAGDAEQVPESERRPAIGTA